MNSSLLVQPTTLFLPHPTGTAGITWRKGNVVHRVPTLALQSKVQKAGVETERKELNN